LHIVVLDGFTLNQSDLPLEELKALGNCTIYDRTAPELIIERSKDAEVLITNKNVLDSQTIKALPKLRYIQVLATGYNNIAVDAAKEQKIIVTNVPGYATQSVAQATFALLLELTNQVGYYNSTVRDGRWQKSSDYCYYDIPMTELHGLTMGIVGLGTIGQTVARLANAFGMKVLAFSRSKQKLADLKEVGFCSLDDLFKQSDVVSLHCPLTPETEKLVNAERLAQMKPTALLLNTSRGPLVDELALSQALKEHRIAGAGLDVLTQEPPRQGSPLIGCPNCIITPHIAWATFAARKRWLDTVIQNLKAYIAGRPINVVN
jgi:glycerate dehydrogenase